MSRSTSRQWCEYFRGNQAPVAIPRKPEEPLSGAERLVISQSVQTFQLGESGRGRHFLKCARRYADRTGESDYVEALRLFIAEEQRHARDLGRFMDANGISRRQRQWSNGLFRWLRHRAGLELIIRVLLTAEVQALLYYRALRRATRSAALRRLCARILRDETMHVRFQAERLAALQQNHSRWTVHCREWLHHFLFAATSVVVWLEHRSVLRAGGFTWRCFRRQARARFAAVSRLARPQL